MANHNLLLDEVHSGFVDKMEQYSYDYLLCNDLVVADSWKDTQHIIGDVRRCFGHDSVDDDYPIDDEA